MDNTNPFGYGYLRDWHFMLSFNLVLLTSIRISPIGAFCKELFVPTLYVSRNGSSIRGADEIDIYIDGSRAISLSVNKSASTYISAGKHAIQARYSGSYIGSTKYDTGHNPVSGESQTLNINAEADLSLRTGFRGDFFGFGTGKVFLSSD